MKWRLIYIDKHGAKPIGEFDIPHDGTVAGNKYAAVDLVWGTSPEGHLFAEIPHNPGSTSPFMSLQLRNPYYDYWRAQVGLEPLDPTVIR